MLNNKQTICNKILDSSANFINLSEIKHFLRIDTESDDSLLETLRSFAIETCEKNISKTITPKKYQIISYDTFIRFPFDTIAKIESVKMNGILLDDTQYVMNLNSSYLNILTNQQNSVFEIIFTVGIENIANIPNDIKLAVLSHISSLYDNKDGSVDMPPICRRVYNTYRKIRI